LEIDGSNKVITAVCLTELQFQLVKPYRLNKYYCLLRTFVGLLEGLGEGVAEGRVGEPVTTVGLLVGVLVGALEGTFVGIVVGDFVDGCKVGACMRTNEKHSTGYIDKRSRIGHS
jgi:hypothetical protein